MKPKRLAITISGAVSLGSYEAGVLYEVFTAIDAHNRTAANAEDRIEIDVLTGASAGGMTAAIAAQLLIGKDTPHWRADDNPFYNAWVKRIDLSGLARMRDSEDPMQSLLSSDCVAEIAGEVLPGQFAATARHSAAPQSGDIWLGLALSNLTGVDYAANALNGGEFIYTRYQDRLVRNAATAQANDWEEIRLAALACGAFPIAFRVRELIRRYEEYFGGDTKTTWTRQFAYTDGGVFDNQPLGMARNLVAKLDRPGDNDSRFYLFVSPWPKSSSIGSQPLQAKDATFFSTTKALISAVFNQGRFQDWIMAESVNDSLSLLNTRAEQLALLMLNDNSVAGALGPAAKLLAQQFIGGPPLAATAAADTPSLDDERDRLRKEFARLGDDGRDYARELEDSIGRDATHAWLDALLVLEYAGRLRDKAEMVIYDITADNHELAGWKINAFAGFFDERFRQHDYEVGRQKTRDWLKSLSSGNGKSGIPSLGPINYAPVPEQLPSKSSSLVRDLQLKDMPKGPRRLLRDLAMQRINRLIDEYIKAWVVGPLVRMWLKGKVADVIGKKLEL